MKNRISLTIVAGALLASACGSTGPTIAAGADGADPAAVSIAADVSTSLDLPTTVVFEPTTATSVASSTTTAGGVTATTAAGGTTTSTSSPPSTMAAASCSAGPPPAGEETGRMSLDVDGDGTSETVFAAFYAPVWMVVVEFDSGEYVAVPIVDAEAFDPVRVVGGARFIGDKTDDIVVSVGGGAYTTSIGFIRYADCELTRMTWSDGSPASFLSGASIGNFSGIYCSTGNVEQYFFNQSGEDDDGSPLYEGGFTPYNLEGTTFVEFPGDGSVLTLDELRSINTFSCFDIAL